ncbi:MAG: Holliday junction branch migration protein RuvA [Oscillospiraceae bacterium]|jgi:Holliday junction DNA helicase RuvA|nr:Holliday junction branch migration protein RuvA [Oscillospiraceae bacterium]
MIAFIEGVISEKRANELVIDTQGVGWSLNCSSQTVASSPPINSRVRIYTRLLVREDAMELFGFATLDERTLFDKLCTISGIGPRTALAVLGALSVRDMYSALANSDANAFARAPGIGKKTAQRIILELRDKLVPTGGTEAASPIFDSAVGMQREAVAGLVSLGYSAAEAQRAVDRAVLARSDSSPSGKTEDIIMEALKRIGGSI